MTRLAPEGAFTVYYLLLVPCRRFLSIELLLTMET